MTGESFIKIDAKGLREAGREPPGVFHIFLDDGSWVAVQHLLRVLPGKRIVGEGEWNGLRVLAKFFVAKGSARYWHKEKNGIEALQRAGIETPTIRMAKPIPGGGHVLLTDFIPGAQSLAEAWHPVSDLPAGDEAALAVLRPAFQLLGRLHAKGLVQEDLHLGNFLHCNGKYFVIDGDAIGTAAPGNLLDLTTAMTNLAVLLAQLPVKWDEAWGELLEAYRESAGRIVDLPMLSKALIRVRARRLKDYLDKTRRDCTLFTVERRMFSFVAMVRQAKEHLSALIRQPDQAMQQGKFLKDGRTCTVALLDQGHLPLVIKRYNLKNLRHILSRFWRPSRAWHSWREGHRLLFYGIPTPEPLALIEERCGPFRRRAFLINAYCPGTNLLSFLSPDAPPPEEVGREIASLFDSMNRLHITHGDLKATNLLWHDGQIVVIDLDAMTQHKLLAAYQRAWKRDRARFLRNWPASTPLHQWLDKNLPPVSDSSGRTTTPPCTIVP